MGDWPMAMFLFRNLKKIPSEFFFEKIKTTKTSS
jgi:hypothetical protein